MKNLTSNFSGSLRQGDVITFSRAPKPRWKRILYLITHFKFYKEPPLRQFVITDVKINKVEIVPDET